MKTDPVELPKLSEKALRDLLLDFVSAEEHKQRAGSYIQSTTKAVKSWLVHNGIRLTLPIRIRGTTDTPTLREERTPTREELRAILLAATPRDRVSCSLMAFSGLRPEVLGNYRGSDGLRVGDIKGLVLTGDGVEFANIPALVEVRRELSKAGHRYFTFLGREACEYVQQYLRERLRSAEQLELSTDLIHPKGTGGSHDKAFVTTVNVGDGIRNAIRRGGFRWRPYVLRAYFDTQLLLAESKGKVAHDYRIFWMGHKGSMEARYTTNKGRLPSELIEDMREAYTRCESFLSTTRTGSDVERDERTLHLLLRVGGFSEEELGALEIDTLSDEEIIRLAEQKLGRRPKSRTSQVSVPLAEVDNMLANGWEYVAPLGRERVILKSGAPSAGISEQSSGPYL